MNSELRRIKKGELIPIIHEYLGCDILLAKNDLYGIELDTYDPEDYVDKGDINKKIEKFGWLLEVNNEVDSEVTIYFLVYQDKCVDLENIMYDFMRDFIKWDKYMVPEVSESPQLYVKRTPL